MHLYHFDALDRTTSCAEDFPAPLRHRLRVIPIAAISLYTLHFDEFFDEDAKVLVCIIDLYGVHKMSYILKFVIIRPGLTVLAV